MAESGSDLFFSNKLQQVQFLHDHVIPQRDFFVNIAKQFDLTMAFIDVRSMASIPISKLVKDTFLFLIQNQESKSTKRELWAGVVQIWGIIHALEVNRCHVLDFQKIVPPTNHIEEFYRLVLPVFKRVTNMLSTTVNNGGKL